MPCVLPSSSAGTADYMGRARNSCMYGGPGQPGVAEAPMLGPSWRARAVVDDVPCTKPSVVAEHARCANFGCTASH